MSTDNTSELKGTILGIAGLSGKTTEESKLQGKVTISKEIGELKGTILSTSNLIGKTVEESKLQGIISIPKETSKDFKLQGTITLPREINLKDYYDGPYEVIPKIISQIMNTEDKVMKENLVVSAIPYFETSNLTGKTVYIGGE